MAKLTGGIMPASMTLWRADESYNPKAQEKYWQWLLDNGATGLSACGSTGENLAMGIEEQKVIMKHLCDFVDGKVPVYIGTGRYSTAETIELSKYAEECGADGVMVIIPYYFVPHKRAVVNHYRELRKNIDIDIMLYNNPNFTGIEFTAQEVKELVDEGLFKTIKAAQGSSDRVYNLKHECGDDLVIMYGHDYVPMEAFFAGADGWLSGLPAVFPKFCRKLYDACVVEKDVAKAQEIWSHMIPFMNYFFTYKTNDPHWLEMFKYVLEAQGVEDVGIARRPMGPVSDLEKKKIDKVLEPLSKYL